MKNGPKGPFLLAYWRRRTYSSPIRPKKAAKAKPLTESNLGGIMRSFFALPTPQFA
jgi:hypothetical protein